jgi:glycosyltransferase involved in cell wall biosynthesis
MEHRILIIVPAYNEEKNIPLVIREIKKQDAKYDILIINDGSSDATLANARAEQVYVIDLAYNLGIGSAVQTGFLFAREYGYDMCVQCDGDGQHPAYQIRKLLRPLFDGEADMAIGSRFRVKFSHKASWSRRAGIWFLSWLISVITARRVTDPTMGFRAYNRRAIENFCRIYPFDYPEPEALVLACKMKLRVKEVPIKIRNRKLGSSSINPFDAVYYMIKVTIAIMIDLFERIEEPQC